MRDFPRRIGRSFKALAEALFSFTIATVIVCGGLAGFYWILKLLYRSYPVAFVMILLNIMTAIVVLGIINLAAKIHEALFERR